jgi:hypothetical protein
LNTFISEKNKENFDHTNIYNKKWILKIFEEFFDYQHKLWRSTRTTSELKNRNKSLIMTIGRKYWRKWLWYVNREQFTKDYNLDSMQCTFKRESQKQTPITIERIKENIIQSITDQGKRTPTTIKPRYLKRLGKRYRDNNWKIDRIIIIYKILYEDIIAKQFRHRYKYNRLISAPRNTTNKPYKNLNEYWNGEKNPEEILIQKEEDELKEKRLNEITKNIQELLSTKEQETIKKFIESNNTQKENIEIENILKKLKNKQSSIIR